MRARLITISSIGISICIVISTLVLLGAIFLQNTLFSTSFYQKVTTSPHYIQMLRQAIALDMSAQSSYVAIPIESLTAGLDDEQLKESLQSHIQNTVNFLNFQADFKKAEYPADLFYQPLEAFIRSNGKEEGYEPTQEQLDLLHQVAADSAAITMTHVNLLNMDLVKDDPAFKQLHRLIFQISRLAWPAGAVLLAALILLAYSKRRHISEALLYAFSSFWIVGILMYVPSLVLTFFGLTKRLAIRTAYLKYAVDSWLTISNRYFLYVGLGIIILSTGVLVTRILTSRARHRHHLERKHTIVFDKRGTR